MRTINPDRLKKALSYTKQKKVADYLKVSTTTVSRWVKGERPVPTKYNAKIARAVDKRLTWLYGGKND